MSKIVGIVVTAVAAAVISGGAFAQGRHDEKPHGMAKSTVSKAENRRAGTGGRHAEGGTTHGPRKPAKKDTGEGAAQGK